MKKTVKRLLSVIMAVAMMATLLTSALASGIEPYSGRFQYYTSTGPWECTGTMTVTAEESQKFQDMEDRMFSIMKSGIPGGDLSDAVCDSLQKIIRENNWDNADEGTYVFDQREIVRYKKHLLTGSKTVELRQIEFRISFSCGTKSNTHNITVTVDH